MPCSSMADAQQQLDGTSAHEQQGDVEEVQDSEQVTMCAQVAEASAKNALLIGCCTHRLHRLRQWQALARPLPPLPPPPLPPPTATASPHSPPLSPDADLGGAGHHSLGCDWRC